MKKILFAAAAALLACSCDYNANEKPEVYELGIYSGSAHIERLAAEQGYGDLSYGQLIDSLTATSDILVANDNEDMVIYFEAYNFSMPNTTLTSIEVKMSHIKYRTMGNRVVSWDDRSIPTSYGDVDIETTYIESDDLEIELGFDDGSISCPTGTGYFSFVGGNHKFYIDLTLTNVPGLTDDGAIVNMEFDGQSSFEFEE